MPNNSIDNVITVAEAAEEAHEEFLRIQRGEVQPPLTTGFRELDDLLEGLLPTLIVIGAQPGHGKSAFVAGLVRELGRRAVKVGVFSLEDHHTWLPWRLFSYETGIRQMKLRRPGLSQKERNEVNKAKLQIQQYGGGIFIDDRRILTPRKVAETAEQMILQLEVQLIMIDHLQELKFENKRRERFDLDVTEGLSTLREIANKYRIPVICLSQLKRESEASSPALSDFANSAGIEREARVAIALAKSRKEPNELGAWVLKNTNGPTGFVRIPFFPDAGVVGAKTSLRSVS